MELWRIWGILLVTAAAVAGIAWLVMTFGARPARQVEAPGMASYKELVKDRQATSLASDEAPRDLACARRHVAETQQKEQVRDARRLALIAERQRDAGPPQAAADFMGEWDARNAYLDGLAWDALMAEAEPDEIGYAVLRRIWRKNGQGEFEVLEPPERVLALVPCCQARSTTAGFTSSSSTRAEIIRWRSETR